MAEIDVLRQQTLDYIGYKPSTIDLTRFAETPDGAGGFKKEPTQVGDQTFRVITQSTNAGVFRRTIDGQELKPDFVLLGPYDANVKHGDWCDIEGVKYEVLYVRTDRSYETWAEVAYRG